MRAAPAPAPCTWQLKDVNRESDEEAVILAKMRQAVRSLQGKEEYGGPFYFILFLIVQFFQKKFHVEVPCYCAFETWMLPPPPRVLECLVWSTLYCKYH